MNFLKSYLQVKFQIWFIFIHFPSPARNQVKEAAVNFTGIEKLFRFIYAGCYLYFK